MFGGICPGGASPWTVPDVTSLDLLQDLFDIYKIYP